MIDGRLENASLTWPQDIKSIHCDVAHPGRPLIQYVLMIDAGSSGSRIHAYKFNYCKATPELESELFEQLQPGLSKYDDDAEAAAESLDQLLDAAMKEIPKFLHKSTPIAVKATAGLRMLGPVKSGNILAAVRKRLETEYPFPIIKEEGVAVMDGADEGKLQAILRIAFSICLDVALTCLLTHGSLLSNIRRLCMGHCQLPLGKSQLTGKGTDSRRVGPRWSIHSNCL